MEVCPVANQEDEPFHVLSVGYRADAHDGDLREMTAAVNQLGEMSRAANPVGEMTRAIREAQAPYRALEVPDVMKSLREDGIAARIPESVASVPRNLAASVPESVLEKTLTRNQRSAIEAAANPGGAFGHALADIDRLRRLSGQ